MQRAIRFDAALSVPRTKPRSYPKTVEIAVSAAFECHGVGTPPPPTSSVEQDELPVLRQHVYEGRVSTFVRALFHVQKIFMSEATTPSWLACAGQQLMEITHSTHTTQEALVRVPQPGRKELPITPNSCAHSENLPLSFAAPPPACDRDRSTGASVAVCALHTPLAVTPGTPALAMGTRPYHYGSSHYPLLHLSCLCSLASGNEI